MSPNESRNEHAGPRTITCPPAGQRVTFLETAADTDGAYTRIELWLDVASNSEGPVEHVHPHQDEQLTVNEGQMGIKFRGEQRVLEPGESVTFPKGEAHKFWNAGDEELVVEGELRPAMQSELFMRLVFGLSQMGLTTPSGIPLNPFRIAVLLDAFEDHLYVAHLPVWLQKAGARWLAPLGRTLGYSLADLESVTETIERE
jgi:mannose-6-phosphate isomerase-like protein (cupin superfamily)